MDNIPCPDQVEESKRAFAISGIDASAMAAGVCRPDLYRALAREPYITFCINVRFTS
jgi:hypothetical protein